MAFLLCRIKADSEKMHKEIDELKKKHESQIKEISGLKVIEF